ncbi:MAG: hypothetical protein J6A36_04310 [Clostridia bacterium]|nr:hypothetical protein [Clostridia bacterium]
MKINKIIERANNILNTDNNRTVVFEFLEKYIKCEIICKQIIKKYLDLIGEEYEEETIPCSLNDIKKAISFYEINFNNPKLLTRLWSKTDKRGEKAVRVLRNKIVHELQESSLMEVIERKEELHNDMDLFITTILDSEINIF